MASSSHHKILIIGGGTGGICVASRLANAGLAADVAIIEPSSKHYYQPLWTLVAAGVYPMEQSGRPFQTLLPRGVHWYHLAASKI
jgi:sulfide:quinone oxidoreductase